MVKAAIAGLFWIVLNKYATITARHLICHMLLINHDDIIILIKGWVKGWKIYMIWRETRVMGAMVSGIKFFIQLFWKTLIFKLLFWTQSYSAPICSDEVHGVMLENHSNHSIPMDPWGQLIHCRWTQLVQKKDALVLHEHWKEKTNPQEWLASTMIVCQRWPLTRIHWISCGMYYY